MMPKVQILLASYNGEKYIRKQLDSILSQTFTDWELLVRDDGSKDGTVEILKEYAQKDSRIHYSVNQGSVHGWQQNFQELILSARENSPYYMFCDQDDIWLKEKIARLIRCMEKISAKFPEKALAVYADMAIVNKDDEIQHESFNALYHIRLNRAEDSFFSQRVYGCNMIMNTKVMRDMKSFLCHKIYPELSHDGLAAKILASSGGMIYYLDKVLMHYRRTGENATANQEFSFSAKKLAKMFGKQLARQQSSAYIQGVFVAEKLLAEKPFALNTEMLQDMRTALRGSGLQFMKIWQKYGIDCGSYKSTLAHFWVLFTGQHLSYLETSNLLKMK